MAVDERGEKDYRPVGVSRRSELIAWGIASVLICTIALLRLQARLVPLAITILGAFFFLAAFVISFGNWMERRTWLRITPDRLTYFNGVRKVSLAWDQVREVRLDEDRLSKKVYILGDANRFQFRLRSEPRFDREEHGTYGFREVEEILQEITTRSGIEPVDQNEDRT